MKGGVFFFFFFFYVDFWVLPPFLGGGRSGVATGYLHSLVKLIQTNMGRQPKPKM
jgi:hypothetical protein